MLTIASRTPSPLLRCCAGAVVAWCMAGAACASDLIHVIAQVKPAIVGIGTFQKTRSPAVNFVATGFVVGDGLSVISNAHGIPDLLDSENKEVLGVVVAQGEHFDFRPAEVAGIDKTHDLVHLRLTGAPLPALQLGDSDTVPEGRSVAFTGFPLGMVLGLHHVTHRATVSALTPVTMPSISSRKLDVRVIAQLQKSPFSIFQLDGTAYPGNSGSPVYDPENGEVLAVINMVFVKGLKETAITSPSGITYAIPVNFVRTLLQQKGQ
ncbi:MAG: serine protease [Pseudomonadota bacterium]